MRKKINNFLLKIWFSQETIEKTYIFMYWKWKDIKKPFSKMKNTYLYIISKRSQLEYNLRKKLLSGKENFWDNDFYQSYPPLAFKGERDSQWRYKNYKLETFLDSSQQLLDIWWNVWFFSLYISKYVKSIDVLEYSKLLVDIWNEVKIHENIKNVEMIQQDFNSFDTLKKYDVIFSFAVHKWIWIPFYNYTEKLIWLLSDDGFIFLESQNLEIDPFEENMKSVENILDIIEYIDIKEPNWYLRKMAICKKKKNKI